MSDTTKLLMLAGGAFVMWKFLQNSSLSVSGSYNTGGGYPSNAIAPGYGTVYTGGGTPSTSPSQYQPLYVQPCNAESGRDCVPGGTSSASNKPNENIDLAKDLPADVKAKIDSLWPNVSTYVNEISTKANQLMTSDPVKSRGYFAGLLYYTRKLQGLSGLRAYHAWAV